MDQAFYRASPTVINTPTGTSRYTQAGNRKPFLDSAVEKHMPLTHMYFPFPSSQGSDKSVVDGLWSCERFLPKTEVPAADSGRQLARRLATNTYARLPSTH